MPIESEKLIGNSNDDLSNVLLGLQVGVGVNDFLEFEYLVDDGYCLLRVGFDRTVHGFESATSKINDFS